MIDREPGRVDVEAGKDGTADLFGRIEQEKKCNKRCVMEIILSLTLIEVPLFPATISISGSNPSIADKLLKMSFSQYIVHWSSEAIWFWGLSRIRRGLDHTAPIMFWSILLRNTNRSTFVRLGP